MKNKLAITFLALITILTISCKKSNTTTDTNISFCDCANSETLINIDTLSIMIPNIITPNGDGYNDCFQQCTPYEKADPLLIF